MSLTAASLSTSRSFFTCVAIFRAARESSLSGESQRWGVRFWGPWLLRASLARDCPSVVPCPGGLVRGRIRWECPSHLKRLVLQRSFLRLREARYSKKSSACRHNMTVYDGMQDIAAFAQVSAKNRARPWGTRSLVLLIPMLLLLQRRLSFASAEL